MSVEYCHDFKSNWLGVQEQTVAVVVCSEYMDSVMSTTMNCPEYKA